MASTIRIKRSATSGNPSTLGQGELAYSFLTNDDINGGDRLYIGTGTETAGNAANHVVIGGKYFTDLLDHTRGTLQASSALITDADSKLDNLKVDNLDLNGNTISSSDANGNIVLDPNGTGYVSIVGTNGVVIPVGTTLQRGPTVQGTIRYNTDTSSFEGYSGTNWGSLGGVRSVDGLTYISAELNPGDSDDTIRFYAATGAATNVLAATLTSSLFRIGSSVATTQLDATTASTSTTTGALTVAGGVGIAGGVHVGGNLTLTGTLSHSGDATFNANVTLVGSNTAATEFFKIQNGSGADKFVVDSHSGNTTITGTLGVTGATTLSSTLQVNGDTTIGQSGTRVATNIYASTLSVASNDDSTIGLSAANAAAKTLSIVASNSLGDANIEIGSANTDNTTILSTSKTTVTGTGELELNSSTLIDVNSAGTITIDSASTTTLTASGATVNADTVLIQGTSGSGDTSEVTIAGRLDVDNIRLDGNTISTTDGSNTLYIDPAPSGSTGLVVIEGNLQVNGTQTTVNSTTVTIDDPIFVLGGDTAPTSDDNLDRGIEYRWHDGTNAKIGFFGYDDSASEFIFVPDATDTSSVISGDLGAAAFKTLRLDGTTESTTTNTGTLKVVGGVGIQGQLNVGGLTSKFTAATASTSTTTGAVVVAGGVGVGGTMYIGDDIVGSGPGTLASPGSVIDGFMIDGGTY